MDTIHKPSPKRITSQQQAVFEVIRRIAGHVTADQVYQEVRKSLPRISLATVYRNLDKLADAGLIGKAVIGGVYYFELETGPHYHVICLACKLVENIDTAPASDIESFFARDTTFKLTGHELVLYGVCPKCQSKR